MNHHPLPPSHQVPIDRDKPIPKAEIREWLHNLHSDKHITTDIYYNLLDHLRHYGENDKNGREMALAPNTLTSTDALPIPLLVHHDLQETPGSGVRVDNTALDVSPAIANEYRRIHNKTFGLNSPPTSPDLRFDTFGEGLEKKSWWRKGFARLSTTRNSKQKASDNAFMKTIQVDLMKGATRTSTLLIDTGSDFSILSRQLGELLNPNLQSARPEYLANTGGGHMNTLGEIDVRWWYNHERFPRKFVDTKFQVSERELDVDALIGWRDICDLGLVSLNPHIPFVGVNVYTTLPPCVNARTMTSEEAAAASRRQAEESQMRNDEYERRRKAFALNEALGPARYFAEQQKALHGSHVIDQAFGAKYQQLYREAYDAYPLRYPKSR